MTLKAHQIEYMMDALRMADASCQALTRVDSINRPFAEIISAKLDAIRTILLRASLSDVAVEGETTT